MTTPAPPLHASSVAVRRLFAAALCAWAPVVLWYAHSAGVRHDYRHYLPQWQLVLRGQNPWSTDNAYGPLYNVLAYLLGFGPLGPELAMAGCLVLAVGLLGRALLRTRAPASSLLLYFVVLPGNCLVISVGFAYGLNDTLAAALVSFALLARLRERDVPAGVLLGLAVLLKYYPAVLVPWFALEHGRLRWRLGVAAGATVALGLAAAAGVWGSSLLTAFTYGAEREPKLLSVLAALQAKPALVGGSGVLDVLIRFNSVCVVCVVVLSFALGLRLRLHFLEASVLGLLATLLTFKVGHPQFYLPWLCLVAALPLAQRASADRLLWTLLPYVLFLDLFQYGYTWGANGYYHQLTVVRRFGGFVSFGLGVATIATYGVCARVRRPVLTSQEGVSTLKRPRLHEYLLLAVLVFFTDRYRWLMDDAFVYFRYADNLLFLGRGLVYNPGEYIEGFSSPAWMLLLLPLRALRIDYWSMVRGLAALSALGYGVGLIWVNQQLSEPADSEGAGATQASPVVSFPLAASAAHYGITTHFSSGLETPLVQLLAPLYAAALLRPRSAWLQCAVALAPLVRAECALLCALYLGFVWLSTRRIPWWFVGCGSVVNGAWLLFRVLYYADFLPNTFYLKDAAQWSLGLAYWVNVERTHHLSLWLLGLCACAVFGRKHLRRALGPRSVMFVAAVLYGMYVARIGGDMLYHRYAALPVCLGLCGTAGFVEAALTRLRERTGQRAALLLGAAAGLLVGLAFGLRYPPQLPSHPFGLPRGSRKWGSVADPNWHRQHEALAYNDHRPREEEKRMAAYARRRAAGEPAKPNIVAEGFCVKAYRTFDTIIVHDYGLTDPVLARLPREFGRPGHKMVQVEAAQIVQLRRSVQGSGRLWYERANAPDWVQKNHAALAVLERKLHNQHNLAENLRLATTRVKLQ